VVNSADEAKYRFMPSEMALKTYRFNKAFYDEILDNLRSGESGKQVSASVLLISGCWDVPARLCAKVPGNMFASLVLAD
jgi:hypothetical protein